MAKSQINKLQSFISHPLLVVKKENLLYLTGRSFLAGYLLVAKKDMVFFSDGLEHAQGLVTDELKNLKKYLRHGSNLLVEHHITAVELARLKKRCAGINITTGPSPVEILRVIKSAAEIKELTEAQRITAAVFAIAKKQLAKKQWTERGLAQYLRIWGLELGADEVSFDPIVASGSNAAIPHHQPTMKILKPGETIILDFGFKVNGYCSDFTRTMFLKRLPARAEKMYNAAERAADLAFRAAKPGLTGKRLDAVARDSLQTDGFAKYFIHSLGHGTGLEVHEAPGVGPYSQDILRNGMVFSIEPGVYVKNYGGIRIEDLVYFHEGRPRYFHKTSKKLADNII